MSSVETGQANEGGRETSDSIIADLLFNVVNNRTVVDVDTIAAEVKNQKRKEHNDDEHRNHSKKAKKEKREKKKKKKKTKKTRKGSRSPSKDKKETDVRSLGEKESKTERKDGRDGSPRRGMFIRDSFKEAFFDGTAPSTSADADLKQIDMKEEDNDDDLPVGADYTSVLNETKVIADLHTEPSTTAPPTVTDEDVDAMADEPVEPFPLSKNERSPPRKSEVLTKAIAEKGKTAMLPRKLLKAMIANRSSSVTFDCRKENAEPVKNEETHEDEPTKLIDKKKMKIKFGVIKTAITDDDKKNEKDIKESSSEERVNGSDFSNKERSSKKERRMPKESKKKENKEKEKDGRKRRFSGSCVGDTKLDKSRKERSSGSRSPRSSRSRESKPRDDRRHRSRSRSRSRTRNNNERARRFSHSPIDKKKLLEIAKFNAAQSQQISSVDESGKEKPPKSIEEFVSYCQRIQAKQQRENKRERGEEVSDTDSDISELNRPIKHPFHVKPITIVIPGAIQIPSRLLPPVELSLTYPVSSGEVHREKHLEWTPVEKTSDPVPTVCSTVQKLKVAAPAKEKIVIPGSGPKIGPQFPAPVPTLRFASFFTPSSSLAHQLPPPPVPPPSLPAVLPLTSHVTPALLVPPPPMPPDLTPSDLVFDDPCEAAANAPRDTSHVLSRRVEATRRLAEDPNDFEAMRILRDCDVQDLFKNAPSVKEGVGLRLLQKMGWKEGEGLGKDRGGLLEPLAVEIKADRRGLTAPADIPLRVSGLSGIPQEKNHVSMLMELCSKQRWSPPQFSCSETGPSHSRRFLWKVSVNGVVYQPAIAAPNKKMGKAQACQIALQALGVISEPVTF